LRIKDETISTYCKNGMTLIQKTDPELGNSPYYFNRPFDSFEDGFGYPSKEFWIGLENMFRLNQMNNTFLKLEVVNQEDGGTFWVEYDQFNILKTAFDNIPYNFYQGHSWNLNPVRNQYEAYPITSLGNMTSNVGNGTFLFIRPSFIDGNLEDRKKERGKYKYYHDNLYLSFTTLSNETNYECSREYHSGWWYPYSLYQSTETNWETKEKCTHNITRSTNLNGIYDRNINKTTRTIAFCNNKDINKCILPYGSNGWKYVGMKSFKLKSTKMWIGRR